MVHFVGAGSGSPDLITVRGMKLLEKADVVIYAGSLINTELLSYCREDVQLYDSAQMTLEEVLSVMKEAAEKDLKIVRLHSGDPSVYGAVREQMDALYKLNIEYDVTPGVTAAMAAAASLGIEYTLPGVSQSFIITRMGGRTPVPEGEKIEDYVKSGASVAVYLSSGMIRGITDRLIQAGVPGDMPAAFVYKCSWADEKRYTGTLAELADAAANEGISNTAVILIGRAIGQGDDRISYGRSRLYDPEFTTGFRKGTE